VITATLILPTGDGPFAVVNVHVSSKNILFKTVENDRFCVFLSLERMCVCVCVCVCERESLHQTCNSPGKSNYDFFTGSHVALGQVVMFCCDVF
jgi:hypothetical protein